MQKILPCLYVILTCFTSCNLIDVLDFGAGIGEVKIVHFSDTHFRVKESVYDELISKIISQKPDILLFTGDIANTQTELKVAEFYLKQLDIIPNKFVILGNHESRQNLTQDILYAFYSKLGFTLLINEGVSLESKGKNFFIYGYDDLLQGSYKHFDASRLSDYNLILAHEPVFADLLSEEFPLIPLTVFSGHTHGGQVLVGGNPVVLPQGCGKYLAGEYQVGFVRLLVSRGIGYSGLPLRINADRDIITTTF